MTAIAILPIKSLDAAKRRLRDELDPAPRRALAEAMFSDVLVALRRATLIDQVLVVSKDHGVQRIAGGYGAMVADDDDRGHNAAAARGIARSRQLGMDRALLVPGDCPLLDPAELDELLETAVPTPSALIVPDRHGTGTNALLLTPPDALAPSFGPGSHERHRQDAAAAGITARTVELPSLALDIDTPDDLAAVEAALDDRHGGAAHTRGMLRQLARSQG
ncbi:MAG TPA: 2-phospho-L-lactate guanylyltransferase [Solirubrobacteraceae bacterium]|jgi:2-phospho-L-lactate guanylyltransferase|nr:2-phospho-L-lactate guanylyltransferase [Solirubrobacteraceae bacterium]